MVGRATAQAVGRAKLCVRNQRFMIFLFGRRMESAALLLIYLPLHLEQPDFLQLGIQTFCNKLSHRRSFFF